MGGLVESGFFLEDTAVERPLGKGDIEEWGHGDLIGKCQRVHGSGESSADGGEGGRFKKVAA